MQRHASVYSADPFVIPDMSLVAQIIGHLVTAPARLLLCQLAQFLDNGLIGDFLWLVAIGTAAHLHRATRLAFTQSEFLEPEVM